MDEGCTCLLYSFKACLSVKVGQPMYALITITVKGGQPMYALITITGVACGYSTISIVAL